MWDRSKWLTKWCQFMHLQTSSMLQLIFSALFFWAAGWLPNKTKDKRNKNKKNKCKYQGSNLELPIAAVRHKPLCYTNTSSIKGTFTFNKLKPAATWEGKKRIVFFSLTGGKGVIISNYGGNSYDGRQKPNSLYY